MVQGTGWIHWDFLWSCFHGDKLFGTDVKNWIAWPSNQHRVLKLFHVCSKLFYSNLHCSLCVCNCIWDYFATGWNFCSVSPATRVHCNQSLLMERSLQLNPQKYMWAPLLLWTEMRTVDCLLNSISRKMKNLVVCFTAVIFIYSCRSVLFLSLLSD